MDIDPRVEQLLESWHDLRDASQSPMPTPEEHCRDCPELLEPFRELLRLDKLFEPQQTVAQTTRSASPPLLTAAKSEPVQFRVEGKPLGSGGMGILFLARDELGRRVALKFMQIGKDGPKAEASFRREVLITARLQHPGIVPVYGTAEGGEYRPGYAMLHVRGESLDAAITRHFSSVESGAKKPTQVDLLDCFESVCNTMAYAHSRRVIHRDLKPGNVMLGQYGETFVVDWGLAKVLDEAASGEPASEETAIGTDVSNASTEVEVTETGERKGTTAYMPWEQVLGKWQLVDERADVFALGGILCKVLTGQPPFIGKRCYKDEQRDEELTGGFDRLNKSGADGELIALAKLLLEPSLDKRPRDAQVALDAVRAYKVGKETREREERERRMVAEANVVAERKRRRVQLGLAAALVLLVAGGLGFAWWEDRQAGRRALAKATLEREQADRQVERIAFETDLASRTRQTRQRIPELRQLSVDLRRQYQFQRAREVSQQALQPAARGGAADLRGAIEQDLIDLATVEELDTIRYTKWLFIADGFGKGKYNTATAPPAYHAAFRKRGLDVEERSPELVAQQVSGSGIREYLVDALDDWAVHEPNAALRDRLLTVTRAVDPGEWTDRFRTASNWTDLEKLVQLAQDTVGHPIRPAALASVEVLLGRQQATSARILANTYFLHPQDFTLAFLLGVEHTDPVAKIGAYSAARAIRYDNPTVWNNLGNAYRVRGQLDPAEACYREAIRLDSKSPVHHNNLGLLLAERGDFTRANESYRQSIALDKSAAVTHYHLGLSLARSGKLAPAIASFRTATALDPTFALPHYGLGKTYRLYGQLKLSVASYQEARRLAPENALIHGELGLALRDFGDLNGAVASARESVKLDPSDAIACCNLASFLKQRKDFPEAEHWFEESIRLDPKSSEAHNDLGVLLATTGNVRGAIASFRRAVQLYPKFSKHYANLGLAYTELEDWVNAVAAFEHALELDRENPQLRKALANAKARLSEQESRIAPPPRPVKK